MWPMCHSLRTPVLNNVGGLILEWVETQRDMLLLKVLKVCASAISFNNDHSVGDPILYPDNFIHLYLDNFISTDILIILYQS